ncbi:unnamed protein product [Closterium sp. NIES-54]
MDSNTGGPEDRDDVSLRGRSLKSVSPGSPDAYQKPGNPVRRSFPNSLFRLAEEDRNESSTAMERCKCGAVVGLDGKGKHQPRGFGKCLRLLIFVGILAIAGIFVYRTMSAYPDHHFSDSDVESSPLRPGGFSSQEATAVLAEAFGGATQPRDVEVKRMWDFIFVPTYPCPRERRIGRAGDGGKVSRYCHIVESSRYYHIGLKLSRYCHIGLKLSRYSHINFKTSRYCHIGLKLFKPLLFLVFSRSSLLAPSRSLVCRPVLSACRLCLALPGHLFFFLPPSCHPVTLPAVVLLSNPSLPLRPPFLSLRTRFLPLQPPYFVEFYDELARSSRACYSPTHSFSPTHLSRFNSGSSPRLSFLSFPLFLPLPAACLRSGLAS